MNRIWSLAAVLAILAAACSGDGVSFSADGGDWCQRAISIDEEVDDVDPGAGLGDMQSVLDLMNEVADGAPDEIRDDIEVAKEGFELFVDALEDADGNIFEIDESRFAELDDPKFEVANDNIDRYLTDVCGMDTGSDSDSSDDVGDFDVDSGADSSGDDEADSFDDDPGTDGFDPGDGGDSPAQDLDDFDLPDGSGSIRDAIVEAMVDTGFTLDEAECLADALGDDFAALSEDPTSFLELYSDCGIDLARLGELGG